MGKIATVRLSRYIYVPYRLDYEIEILKNSPILYDFLNKIQNWNKFLKDLKLWPLN